MSNPVTPITAESLLAYEPFVRAVARGLLKDEHAVQDVVQETWIRALKHGPTERSSFRAWLAAVTRNLARNRHRGEGRRQARELVVAKPEEQNFEAGIEKLEAHQRVVGCVLGLNEPYKSVVILSYYQELSPTQIAERLGRKPATVRSQLHRAHELLRLQLDGDFGGERGAWAALLLPLTQVDAGSSGPLASAPAVQTPALRNIVQGIWAKAVIGLAAMLAVVLIPDWFAQQGDSGTPNPGRQGQGEVDSLAARGASAGPSLTSPSAPKLSSRQSQTGRTAVLSGQSLVVQVRDGDSVVEGAHVWLIESAGVSDAQVIEQVRSAGDWFQDPEVLFQHFGKGKATSEDGEAQFEWDGGVYSLLTYYGAKRALLTLPAGFDEVAVLQLEETSAVRVEVVDFAGNPVGGVPVALGCEVGDSPSTNPRDMGLFGLYRHRTGASDGATVFRDFEGRVTGVTDAEPKFSVGLAVPGAPTGRVEIDPRRGVDEPVRFRLGPTAPLELRIVTPNGEPTNFEGLARIYGAGQDDTIRAPNSMVKINAGVAMFPHVALGTELEILVTSASMGANFLAQGTSSGKAGQLRKLDVVWPDSRRVSGRVVRESGELVKSTNLYLSICTEELKELQLTRMRTDAKGRFQVELEQEVPEALQAVVRVLRYGDGWDGRADLEHSSVIGPETRGMGDFQLRDVASVLRGRCLTPAGDPIEGLKLSCKLDNWMMSYGDWTDAEGRFEMRGLLPVAPVLTMDSGRWVLPPGLQLAAGPEEHQIQVLEGGVLTGSVVVDEGARFEDLSLVLNEVPGGRQAPEDWRAWARVDSATGSFKLTGIPSGTFSLGVWAHGVKLREINGISVTVSTTSAPDVLQAIDLTGSLVICAVQAHDQGGEGLRSFQASIYSEGKLISSVAGERGQAEVEYAQVPGAVLLVQASGYAPVYVENPQPETVVTLAPGIPVTLSTDVRLKLVEGPKTTRLSLCLQPPLLALGETAIQAYLPRKLTTQGKARMVFPGPGLYTLCYSTMSQVSGGMALMSTVQPMPGNFTIEIRDADRGKALQLELPEALPK